MPFFVKFYKFIKYGIIISGGFVFKRKKKLDITEIKKNIVDYANYTLLLEQEREKSIYKGCINNITCVSILLVPLINVIFNLYDRLKEVRLLIIVFGIILILNLFVSMFLSLKAMWPYKKNYTKSGLELLEHINSNIEQYSKEDSFLDQRIMDVERIYRMLEKNNDKKSSYYISSLIAIYIFLLLLLIFGSVVFIRII